MSESFYTPDKRASSFKKAPITSNLLAKSNTKISS